MSPSINNGSSSSLIITILLSFFLFQTSALNITKLLNRYLGYDTLNSLLTQTKLANEINQRQTITILAIPDAQISGLASKGVNTAKRILSNHVILDYYDMKKLHNLEKGTALLVTLYQSSGVADDKSGFLKVTDTKNGEAKFGLATKGAARDVTLIKLVAAQPYNISVLAVSGPIIGPGVDAGPAGPPLKPVAPPPTAHKKKGLKSPSPMVAESPEEADVALPAEEYSTDAPVLAPEHVDAPANAPTDDGSTADAEHEEDVVTHSNGSNVKRLGRFFCVGLVVSMVSLFHV